MAQHIIYENPEGGVCVVTPSPDILLTRTVEEVAQKDVPAGLPYKIIETTDLPDRYFRNAWEIDTTVLTDGVGADTNEFTPLPDTGSGI